VKFVVKEIKINEWVCDSGHAVFYTYLDDGAVCPECGDPARYRGEATFILRDEQFDSLLSDVIEQECSEGCWVREGGITKDSIEEVEVVIGECAVAKLRKALYGCGCPVKE
jgi:hypothetical protein